MPNKVNFEIAKSEIRKEIKETWIYIIIGCTLLIPLFYICFSSIIIALVLSLVFFWNFHSRFLKIPLEKLKNADSCFDSIASLLQKNTSYIFYLREFKSGDKQRTIYSGGALTDVIIDKYGNERASQIVNVISGYLPTIYLLNIFETTPEMKGTFLLSTNKDWFENFMLLAQKAKYIICDYADNFLKTENIIKEVNFLLELKINNIILFCTEQQYLFIENTKPSFLKHVIFVNYTFYHDFESNVYLRNSYSVNIHTDLIKLLLTS